MPEPEPKPAFHTLLERHGGELHAYLWRMTGNRQDAEDCLQEAFLRAYRAYERTAPGWNFRAWLYRIATNVARTHLRRVGRGPAELSGKETDDGWDPLEKLAHEEQLQLVHAALRRLSLRQRTAIMMRKYSDLDYSVIGEALGCTPETARAHVYQGLRRLRTWLAPSGGKHDGERTKARTDLAG